jgi:ABC-type multidrug transport system fused ATPase/permease subunit
MKDTKLDTTDFNRTTKRDVNTKAADDETDFWHFSRDTSIYIYSVIIGSLIIITLVRSVTFFTVCMRASTRLHDNMFGSITRATMRFFNTNSAGRILNRFSKDMGSIDELLTSAMIDCLQIGLALLGIIIVVAIVSPWLMIPTVIAGVVFYFLRIFYIRTSRNVKRLEGISKYILNCVHQKLIFFFRSKKSRFFTFECIFARFNNNQSFWCAGNFGKGI